MKCELIKLNQDRSHCHQPYPKDLKDWTCFTQWEKLLTLTSSLLQAGALGVLADLWLRVFGQLSQRAQLSLLVLFAFTPVMAALGFSLRSLPPLLLLSAWGGRLLSVVVEDILLLLEKWTHTRFYSCFYRTIKLNVAFSFSIILLL